MVSPFLKNHDLQPMMVCSIFSQLVAMYLCGTFPECCMSGCAICVYDLYDSALKDFKFEVAKLRDALNALDIQETDWPNEIRAQEKQGTRESSGTMNVSLSAFELLEQRLAQKRAQTS
jgi:hypothetical protein